MPCVTLLLTGVPHFVSLKDLSHYLDCLFNTDEIGLFRSRSLPEHPRTKQRQIALDFHSSFDAMAAQKKLDGYKYDLYDGNLYILSAKINKVEEYMWHDSFRPDRSMQDHQLGWSAMGVIPDLSYRELTSAHSKLDVRLELLKKQKLILEAERELLVEKKKLKREYACMVSSLLSQSKHAHDFEEAAPKRLRSSSTESQPGPSGGYSTSKGVGSRECRSRSRSDAKLPQVECDESLRTRELRSHSNERRLRSCETHSRDRGSTSRGPSDLRSVVTCSEKACSKSRERRRSSNGRTHRDPSISISSPERIRRARKSTSRECNYKKRRSTSSETSYRVDRCLSRERDDTDRRSTSLKRNRSLNTHANSKSLLKENITILRKKDASKTIINNATVKNKQTRSAPEKNTKNSDTINGTGGKQSVDKKKTKKKKQTQKGFAKFNSQIREEDNLEEKVESITRDVMFIMLILLEEILIKENIKISNSDKTLLEKTLHELTKKRVEPLVIVENNSDVDVLLAYKLQYTKENDILMIKKMLDDIPKTKESKASANIAKDAASLKVVNGSTKQQEHNTKGNHTGQNKDNELQETRFSGSNLTSTEEKEIRKHPESTKKSDTLDNTEFIDMTDLHTNVPEECNKKQEENANNLTQSENKDNFLRIQEDINEPNESIVTIDIDSSAKPVPKRPQFFLVIKYLLKDMKKVIIRVMKNNNSSDHVYSSDLQYVLRRILTNLMKGHAYKSKNEIINIFRASYPKDKDAQFLKEVIQDIEDGKYPVLAGPPAAEGPSEDDVILIENKYEVITVVDSDDDDSIQAQKEVINPLRAVVVDCETTPPSAKETYPANPGSEVTGRADNGTAYSILKLLGLAHNNPTDLEPSKPGTSMHVPVRPSSSNLDSTEVLRPNPGLSCFTQVNPNQANFGSNNLTPAKPISKPGPVHAGSVNNDSTEFRLTKPGTSKLVAANLDTSKLRLVNPGSANSSPSDLTQINPNPANFGPANLTTVKTSVSRPGSVLPVSHNLGATGFKTAYPDTSKHVRANPDTSKLRLVSPGSADSSPSDLKQINPNPANFGPANLTTAKPSVSRPGSVLPVSQNRGATGFRTAKPDTSKLVRASPDTSKLRLINPESANPRPTSLRPVNPGPPNLRPVNPGPNLKPIYPGIFNCRPVDPDPSNYRVTNLRPVNCGISKFLPASLRPIELRPANAGTSKIGSVNSGLATTGVAKTGIQAMKKTGSQTQPRVEANTDEEDLKSKCNENDAKTEMANAENAKDPKDATKRIEESNSNSLKVTAITNVTSLNELSTIDKTTDGPKMDVPIESIEEEIPFENSDTEQTKSRLKTAPNQNCLVTTSTEIANTQNAKSNPINTTDRIEDNSSNDLKVTAITIMTSLNELSAITDKTTDRPSMAVPIESIKEEIPFEKSDADPIDSPLQPTSNQNPHVTSSTEMPNIENAKGNPVRRTQGNEDSNSNNLKVTAITIMTSLNELTAIVNNDGSRVEAPIEDIKEEIQFENSDAEQIDSPLKKFETKEIEETVHCDKEKAKPNNSVVVNKDQIANSCVNGERQRALGKQGNGSGLTTNEKEMILRNSLASDDEDETIESIVKYVQSMI